jgi:hypothetical protein
MTTFHRPPIAATVAPEGQNSPHCSFDLTRWLRIGKYLPSWILTRHRMYKSNSERSRRGRRGRDHTGYLGGAKATHVRVLETQFLVPLVLGVLIWGGLFLRDPRMGGLITGPRGAATLLDLHPSTLRNRMKKLGITRGSHQIWSLTPPVVTSAPPAPTCPSAAASPLQDGFRS